MADKKLNQEQLFQDQQINNCKFMKIQIFLTLVFVSITFAQTDTLKKNQDTFFNAVFSSRSSKLKECLFIGLGQRFIHYNSNNENYEGELTNMDQLIILNLGYAVYLNKRETHKLTNDLYFFREKYSGTHYFVFTYQLGYSYYFRLFDNIQLAPQIGINISYRLPYLLSVGYGLNLEYKLKDFDIFLKGNYYKSLLISKMLKVPVHITTGIIYNF